MSALPEQKSVGDSLTILTSAGPRLTKVWDSATGKPLAYEKVQQVSVQERFVSDIYGLSALLTELEGERNTCIIRGKFIGHAKAKELYPAEIERELRVKKKVLQTPKDGFTLRRLTFFKEQALHFFYIDIDSYLPEGLNPVLEPEACINQYVARSLPACFQGITFHWQLSSGAGHPDNPGVLKAHVAFWLSTPHLGDDLDAWVKSTGLPVDVSVFRTVQPNYTAAPVFVNGVQDPVPVRSGLCEGFLGDVVNLQIDPVIVLRARTERKGRAEMVDPRDKENLIGLFCRTYEIEDVVANWLNDQFEFVTEWRLNWLGGGGAGEGAGVTENRQGIFNTHNTDPFHGRAANKWDLVRHYKFGHLDVGMDAFEMLDIQDRPSQVAMKEFVLGLPEIVVGQVSEVIDSTDPHRAAVEAATTERSLRETATRISLDGGVDRAGRDTLAGLLQIKWRSVTGVKLPLPTARSMLALSRSTPTGPAVGPDWVQPWCYVAGEARFFNRNTKELITREAFDASFGRLMELDADGNIPQASRLACDAWEIPVVYERMYLPSAGELFTLDGREYANDYRPESEPLGVADAGVNEVLLRHIELLIPDAGYRALLLQWAAWVVRNPGKKVLWAVLIKGVEGDGKSVIGSMIAQAMGHINVGIISPETMAGSNFNDWAKGRCVNVLEEIKIPGHRHDVYNKIKPLITNPRIEVHGKGKASTTVINTTNYIGFTNHDDALPLDDKDRRHFVLFTPWRDISGLHDAVEGMGLTVDQYWDQLWDPIKNRPDAVRGFFDSIDISGFNANSRAPATTFKSDLVAAGDFDDAEGHAKLWVEEGCFGVGKTVVSSNCLTRALANMDPPIKIHTSRVRKVLTGMGFEQTGFLKWKGSTHRVWVHAEVTTEVTSLSTDWLRGELDKTDLGGLEDFLK